LIAITFIQQLIPEKSIQFNLFVPKPNEKVNIAIKAMDELNRDKGMDLIRFAIKGFERKYRLRADHL
jgi:antitoxin component of RelBE/YafQ-DinJ toxin-antitoxin module